jgi:AraC-like DNA-binding protein
MGELVGGFASRDIDAVAERLGSVFQADTRIDYFGDRDLFSVSFVSARLGSVVLARRDGVSFSLTRVNEGAVHILVPISGPTLRHRSGSRIDDVSVGGAAAVGRPFETVGVMCEKGVAFILRAPVSALIGRAEQLAGESLGGAPLSQMLDRVNMKAPIGDALGHAMRLAFTGMRGLSSAGLAPLAASAFEDLLTSLAAAALFPLLSQRAARAGVQQAPAAIRRARDFIKENSGLPIELSKLAADLGLPMRTLQENFRRSFGQSPRAWLLDCRMEDARQRLTSPDQTASVSSVALDCGFGDLSDFAAKYRRRFGESPSETLRFAQRRRL